MYNEKKNNYEFIVILLIGVALIFLIFIFVRKTFNQNPNINNGAQSVKVEEPAVNDNQVVKTELNIPQTEEVKNIQAEQQVLAVERAKKFQAVGEILKDFTVPTNWNKFDSPIGNFSAIFPKSPKHESIDINIPGASSAMKYDMYTGEADDGTIYFVGVSTYPLDINDSNYNQILRESLTGIVSVKSNNQLITVDPSSFKGHHALNCLIYNADNVYTKGRSIVSGSNIYHVLVTAHGEKYNDDNYNAFMSAFTLK
jgi:hypothetical protein